MLHGRGDEQATIDGLLAAARSGISGSLVVRGEPGIGKSALLEYAAEQAAGFRVIRADGSEIESGLPFAGLHMLLGTALDRLSAIPEPQAAALSGAFGLTGQAADDRFFVGLAVLSLLSELAEDSPLLGVIDDAQWLDRSSAEALVFAARRLEREGVLLMFGMRDAGGAVQDVLAGLPELWLPGLDRDAACGLLAEHDPGLAPDVREWLLTEIGGNPLALIELPTALTPEHRSGRFLPRPFGPGSLPLSRRVQIAFGAQAAMLTEPTRALLLVAAAEETGELNLVLRAAERFGAGPAQIEEAERSGLLAFADRRVAFKHSLARAAVLQAAPLARRLAAHRVLAEVLAGYDGADAAAQDRVAWHLAAAVTGPDEKVAGLLVAAAERAGTRTGFVSQAAALERAAELTSAAGPRSGRLVAAAEAAAAGGDTHRAAAIADRAGRGPLDGSLAARLACVRAAVEFQLGFPMAASRTLVAAATGGPDGPPPAETAAPMLVDAIRNAYYGGNAEVAIAAAARLIELTGDTPVAAGMMGVARLLKGDWAYAVPRIRALTDFALSCPPGTLAPRERLVVVAMSLITGGEPAVLEELEPLVAEARDHAMVGWLPVALKQLAFTEFFAGRMRDSRAHAEEGLILAESTGQTPHVEHLRCFLGWFAALAGDEKRCRELAEPAVRLSLDREDVGTAFMGTQALVLLDSGLGRHEHVLDRVEAARSTVGDYWITYCAPDQIEAAVRAAQPARIAQSLEHFCRGAEASGRPWAMAVAQRCLALVATGEAAEGHYIEALALHRQGGRPFERARTELLYGEYLRRCRRKTEARTRLRLALETFERLAALPWAERARAELRATGEPALLPPAESALDKLTPQERRVIQLAAQGLSNRDIGARLFLSPRTVGYHLYKAFPKLGVASRTELVRIDLKT